MSPKSPMRCRGRNSAVGAAALALLVSTGCGAENGSTGNGSETPLHTAAGTQAIQARYVVTFPEDSDYRVVYEVVTAGEQRVRISLTVPSDYPVTVYRWVWDGHRVLEYGNESDPPSYTLYEAPAEEEGLLPFISSWIATPGSDDFAKECPDAQHLDTTKTIAGRPAIGFRCGTDRPQATLWIDQETHLLLSQTRIPSEGSENGVLRAEEVTPDPRIDDTTFSTNPPPGADVEVIESTGAGAPPPDESDSQESAAALDAELREIAATTASSTPIYYVGTEFRGEALSDVVIFDVASGGEAEGDHSLDPGQNLGIMYGEHFQMDTNPFRAANYRRAVGCRRLPSLRGVPTVQQSDAVWLFTASFVIRFGDTADAPKKAAAAATALREVGQDEPTGADLPTPPAHIVALVDKACGQTPGDRGPALED